jgi:hypothetical protein
MMKNGKAVARNELFTSLIRYSTTWPIEGDRGYIGNSQSVALLVPPPGYIRVIHWNHFSVAGISQAEVECIIQL